MLKLTSQNDKTQFSYFPTAAKHRKSSPRFGRMMYTFTAGCLLFSPRLFHFLSMYIHWWRRAFPRRVCTDERGKTTAAFYFIFFSLAREREFLSIFHHLHTRCDKSATTTATANKFVSLDSIIIIHQHWRISIDSIINRVGSSVDIK